MLSHLRDYRIDLVLFKLKTYVSGFSFRHSLNEDLSFLRKLKMIHWPSVADKDWDRG